MNKIKVVVLIHIIIAVSLLYFAVRSSNLESDIGSLSYKCTENLLGMVVEISMANTMYSNTVQYINIQSGLNKNLTEILISDGYGERVDSITRFLHSAKAMRSKFNETRIALNDTEDEYRPIKKTWIILSILNGLSAVILGLIACKGSNKKSTN